MRQVVDAVKATGCDALIVADVAALQYVNSIGVQVYISTQMSVSNIEAIRYFSKFSNRLILAREPTMDQVKSIVEEIEKEKITGPNGKLVEIEIFGHGALCVAVSGRCAMSLYCYNSSANKGKCTQICRRQYKVTDIETGQELEVDNNYVFSPKDLFTIGALKEIIAAGVTVLKIEGRGRPSEYVDTVIRCYKEAVKSIIDNTYTQEKIAAWNKELGTVFNRGLGLGMYMGRHWDEWANGSGNQATMEKHAVGIVKNYYKKEAVALIQVLDKITVKAGEECLISGPNTVLVRCKFKDMQYDEQHFDTVTQGMRFTMKVAEPVRVNDKVYVFRGVVNGT